MAGIGPGDLDVAALEVLEAAVAALDAIPTYTGLTTLAGAPTRQYVSPGRPAADCEQVTVHWNPITEAQTPPTGLKAGKRHQQEFRVNLVAFLITVVRCVPSPGSDLKAPARDALEAAAAQINADAWSLWNRLWNQMREGALLNGKCSLIFMDRLVPLEPAGGFGGCQLTIRAQLYGYEGIEGPLASEEEES